MNPGTYRRYMLVVLLAILGSSFVDRITLGVVLQNIKSALHLSDTELGFLGGLAFAVFYSVMGMPIARWADRGNRVTIITVTTALWSVAVAMCGLAGTFLQLLLCRIGAAVGEAGAFPCGISLIADHFDRSMRPRAVAIYALSSPLATIGGYLLAGWLNQYFGWRLTFILIAAPGMLLAAVARLSLRDSRDMDVTHRSTVASPRSLVMSDPSQPGIWEAVATLWRIPTFRNILLCMSVLFFFAFGITTWQPTYFIRTYGFTTGTVGTWFSGIGIAGLLGTYAGGELATRFAPDDEQAHLLGIAIITIGTGLLLMGVYLSQSPYIAFALLGVVAAANAAYNGPLFATVQTLVPERLRAVSVALILLFANLIGMGLGPLAAGALSDAFRVWAGAKSLRYSLLILSPGYFLVAWLAWRASRSVRADIANALCESEGNMHGAKDDGPDVNRQVNDNRPGYDVR